MDRTTGFGLGRADGEVTGLVYTASRPYIPDLWGQGCLPPSWSREDTFHMGDLARAFREEGEEERSQ